jgi:hypothetical protein
MRNPISARTILRILLGLVPLAATLIVMGFFYDVPVGRYPAGRLACALFMAYCALPILLRALRHRD